MSRRRPKSAADRVAAAAVRNDPSDAPGAKFIQIVALGQNDLLGLQNDGTVWISTRQGNKFLTWTLLFEGSTDKNNRGL